MSLSPSACCVAVANGNTISFYQAGRLVLGLKGKAAGANVHVVTLTSIF